MIPLSNLCAVFDEDERLLVNMGDSTFLQKPFQNCGDECRYLLQLDSIITKTMDISTAKTNVRNIGEVSGNA